MADNMKKSFYLLCNSESMIHFNFSVFQKILLINLAKMFKLNKVYINKFKVLFLCF